MFSKFINGTLGSYISKGDFKSNIPSQVLVPVFSYLTSHQIAMARLVNKNFNKAGKKVLNRRFSFYCKFVPKALRNALRNISVFPDEMLREAELQVLSASLLILRSVFGRYIITGRCCFYPGLILDHIEAMTLSSTMKNAELIASGIIKSKGKHLYYRSINKLCFLVEKASNHFERQIEPLLPPPRTFFGTKILDLLASKSVIQHEENICVFYEKITEDFPINYPSNFSTDYLARLRSDIIKNNVSYIFKMANIVSGDLIGKQMKLRWQSSQPNYQSKGNLKYDSIKKMNDFHKITQEVKEEEKRENIIEGESYINLSFPLPVEVNDVIENTDKCNISGCNNINDSHLVKNAGVCSYPDTPPINFGLIKPKRRKKEKTRKRNKHECQCIELNNNLSRSNSVSELFNHRKSNMKLIHSLLDGNVFSMKNSKNNPYKLGLDNTNSSKYESVIRESKTRQMLEKAELLLNKTRKLAHGSKKNIHDKPKSKYSTSNKGNKSNFNLQFLVESIGDSIYNNEDVSYENLDDEIGPEKTDIYNKAFSTKYKTKMMIGVKNRELSRSKRHKHRS